MIRFRLVLPGLFVLAAACGGGDPAPGAAASTGTPKDAAAKAAPAPAKPGSPPATPSAASDYPPVAASDAERAARAVESGEKAAAEDPTVAKMRALEEAGKKDPLVPATTAPTGPPRSAPRVFAAKKEVDFGTKLDGDLCETDFAFENAGDAPLVISRVQPSCGCTVPQIKIGDAVYEFGKGIPPGAEGNIHVTLNLKGIHGAKTSQVMVFSNDPAGPLTLRVQASVEQFFVLEPPQTLNLGEVWKKEGKSGTMKISTKRVPEFKITGWDPLPPGLSLKVEPAAPDAKAAYNLVASVGEGANEGNFSSRVVLHTDVGRQIDLFIAASVVGTLEVKPGPYMMFGLVQRGTKTSRSLDLIARDPEKPIRITGVEVEAMEGGNQTPKSLGEHFTHTLRTEEEGRKYKVEVTALETLPAGVFRGTVRVLTDHPEVPKKEIVLSGFVR